jgi:outer membrane protein assembly factor BamA
MAVARFHAPLLKRDWRLAAGLGTTRETRLGYYGLGNGTDYDSKLVTSNQPHYYQARRARYFGNLEISRRLTGPLWLAGAGGVEYSNLSDLSKPSLFRTDLGTSDISDTDVRGRLTLVFDTRDNEFNTARGLFAQASLSGGTGGDGYSRVTADLRGYVSIREGTVLAARVAGSGMSSGAPLNARYEMPVWEGEIGVLGGTYSNRGLPFQRLAGRGVLFGNAEVRHDLLNLGDLGAFTLFAFVDAGRVFEQRDFELTTKGMKVGAGGGLAIRLLRFTIWTFNFGGGPDGFQFSAGSGWSF